MTLRSAEKGAGKILGAEDLEDLEPRLTSALHNRCRPSFSSPTFLGWHITDGPCGASSSHEICVLGYIIFRAFDLDTAIPLLLEIVRKNMHPYISMKQTHQGEGK